MAYLQCTLLLLLFRRGSGDFQWVLRFQTKSFGKLQDLFKSNELRFWGNKILCEKFVDAFSVTSNHAFFLWHRPVFSIWSHIQRISSLSTCCRLIYIRMVHTYRTYSLCPPCDGRALPHVVCCGVVWRGAVFCDLLCCGVEVPNCLTVCPLSHH